MVLVILVFHHCTVELLILRTCGQAVKNLIEEDYESWLF